MKYQWTKIIKIQTFATISFQSTLKTDLNLSLEDSVNPSSDGAKISNINDDFLKEYKTIFLI